LYEAWTIGLDRWLASPESVLMRVEIDAPFFFEVVVDAKPPQDARRHPHYGRFLRLEGDRLIEMTWVTGAGGTGGAETVLTLDFLAVESGTELRLTHAGFADDESRRRHEEAWPHVLDQLERALAPAENLSVDAPDDVEFVGTYPEPVVSAAYDEITIAFEFVSSGQRGANQAYVSLKSGAVRLVSDFDDLDPDSDETEGDGDDDDLVSIPHKNDLDLGRDLVLRFAAEVLPRHYDEIDEYFHRRGAYARLKDLLIRVGMLDRWYAYEAKAEERALRNWCAENGIALIGEKGTQPG
jgi:uncharacterized protein YndB with AHSA1/START domain